MRITCLIFLAVMSVVVVTECTPLRCFGPAVEKAPPVDSEQKFVRTDGILSFLRKTFLVEPEATTSAPSSYYGQEEYKLKYIGDYYW